MNLDWLPGDYRHCKGRMAPGTDYVQGTQRILGVKYLYFSSEWFLLGTVAKFRRRSVETITPLIFPLPIFPLPNNSVE